MRKLLPTSTSLIIRLLITATTIILLYTPSLSLLSSKSAAVEAFTIHNTAQTTKHKSRRLYSSSTHPNNHTNNNNKDNKNQTIRHDLNKQFLNIASPALIQLTAEPLASIVDTAYLGRLGPEVLGGAGVAISAQYAVSKLYNDPLLRTSISLVASSEGKSRSVSSNSNNNNDDLSVAVSSALLLAGVIGVVQALVYYVGSSRIVNMMGVANTSSMFYSAFSYLRIRALGTPAATLWLVTNGVFRGLGDTKTPLMYSLAFTALNALLDPFFIFTLKFGASGAAAGTAIAQYAALIPLMMALNRKVHIDIIGQLPKLKSTLKEYLRAGVLVFTRTMGKVLAYSVCAKKAALLGSVAAAAYNLTFQLGFATTQVCEAIAVAVQTLMAREMADKTTRSKDEKCLVLRHLIKQSIVAGGVVAGSLSALTFFQRKSVIAGLTTNEAIRSQALAIFPAVLATQVLKGLAYPVNGIVMGGLDWNFTMWAMWLANIVCVGMITLGHGVVSLNRIWWALAAFMGVQVVSGVIRIQSQTGVWAALKDDDSKGKEDY